MNITTKCTKCDTALSIQENALVFSETKVTEKANCPVCNNEVYRGDTDGWYFVQTIQTIHNLRDEQCTYPMS